MHEGQPHGNARKSKGKKSKGKEARDDATPAKHSSAPSAPAHGRYATPPRPTPPRPPRPGGKGHHQNDWSATNRAKADAILASTSSHWYAGAAFDRSPAAHTLPRPTRLLAAREDHVSAVAPTRQEKEDTLRQLMGTSCPSSGAGPAPLVTGGGSKTHVASPEQRSQGDLRAKSQDLLRMLRGGEPEATEARGLATSPAREAPAPPGEANSRGVEELTRQVRKLLNLPPPSKRQVI